MTIAIERALRSIEWLALLLGGGFTLVAMQHGAGWKFEWSWFYPWALSPYVVYFLFSRRAEKGSPYALIAGVIGAVLMLAFTGLVYGNFMWFSKSSTGALVFIFAPFWMLVGGPLVLALLLALHLAICRLLIRWREPGKT